MASAHNRNLIVVQQVRVRMKSLSNVLRCRGLMSTWINHLALRIEGPECVTEQVSWVVHLLDLDEARPVFTETAFRSLRRLVTAKELWSAYTQCFRPAMMRIWRRTRTLGYGPPS